MIDPQALQSITSQIESEMQRLHIPGVALGIWDDGQEFSAGFGVTNLENPLPITADTLFQVGSITKTVTATAMMRLMEQNTTGPWAGSGLDAPIRAFLPDLSLADPTVTERATLRHVFTHTGGWVGDYFDDAGPGDDALKVVVSRMGALAQETPLGQIWSYNNSGFFLAGRVIEILTGKSYETAVRELVLDPLRMQHSFFFARDAITYRVAAGHDAVYSGEERQPEVLRPWGLARASNPLGGLLSSVKDLLRYARFHLGDGTTGEGQRLLSAESLNAMQTPAAPAANGEWMGVSWFLHDLDGAKIVRHGGATNGQMATFLLIPQRKFALVILTNSDRGGELYNPLVKRALADLHGLVEPEPQIIPVSTAELSSFTGEYSSAAQNLRLSLAAGELVLQVEPKGGFPTPDAPPPPAPPPTRLAFCGQDALLCLDEPFKDNRGEFLRDEQGKVAWLRFGGRVHRR